MLSGVRGWAAIGSYPKGCSHVRRLVGRMRVELENAVQSLCGSVSLYQAALIQSACRHEGRALLLTRWLRTESDGARKQAGDASDKPGGLTVGERLAILKEIGNATDSRDRCIRGLGLVEAPDRDPWAVIDSPPKPPDTPDTSAGAGRREHPTGGGFEVSTSGTQHNGQAADRPSDSKTSHEL
jgi:hypothetical protein